MFYFNRLFSNNFRNKVQTSNEKATKIPIRKGSSLERKYSRSRLVNSQKSSVPELLPLNYSNIFDHMKQIDKNNRLSNLFKYRSSENFKVNLFIISKHYFIK